MSDNIENERLTLARCIIATSDCEHDNGCRRKKNTSIILICHSFPSFLNYMSKQFLAPGG